jgi:hypothetical protein
MISGGTAVVLPRVVDLRLCQLVPLAAGLALVGGCVSLGTPGTDAGAGRDDGGPRLGDDASAVDALAADVPPGPPDDRTEANCFDFGDDDGDLAPDCADPGCGVAPICCSLGSAAPGCCGGGRLDAVDLSGCPAGPIAGCVAGALLGGSMEVALDAADGCGDPTVAALVPAVDPNADSGLILPGTLDPRVSRITLRFTLGRDDGTGLGRAGVGLVADVPAPGRVLPLVAVERTNGLLRVVVGEAEEVVGSVAACDEDVTLTVDPTGRYTVTAGTFARSGALDLPDRARAIVYGRRDDGARAWVSGVDVRRDVCTIIAPERSASPVLSGAPADAVIGRIAVARSVPEAFGRAAIEVDGRILPATEVAGGVRVDSLANPLVPAGTAVPGAPDWAGGTADPQLVALMDGYLLLFAGIDDDGSTAIFAQHFGPALDAPGPALALLTSGSPAVGAGVTRIDGPAYFVDAHGAFLFFRAVVAERTELRFVRLDAPIDDAALAGSRGVTPSAGEALYSDATPDPGVVRASGQTVLARDEIASPRVVALGDGVIRVFYSGRRGTRWSIAGLVTTDLRHFDDVAGGEALLGPSGAGFDALGALDPEPVLADAFGERRLVLYYTGTSGTSAALGAAEQAVFFGAAP